MTDTIPFRRVAILGTGLIGGSFALAVRKQFPETSVIGFDRPETAAKALSLGAISAKATNIPEAVGNADLVYIALPISAAIESLPAIAAAAKATALVTDACSTKAVVCAAAKKHFNLGARFLGGHPMAGKEHSGVDHANAGLFRDAPYAVIARGDEAAGEAKDDPRIANFIKLITAIGAKPVFIDADTHDWAVGIVSHLPQLLSIALARVVQDETDETGLPLSLAGPGLQDTLRLAGSPYSVWRDILLTNTDNVSRALDRLAQAVDYLRTQLASKEVEAEFRAANEVYSAMRKGKQVASGE